MEVKSLHSTPASRVLRFAGLVLVLTIPSALAITNQSIWMDESLSAYFADHARLGHLDSFTGISGITNMPLYHLLLAAWVSIWGSSEKALRGFNLPFAALFVGSIALLCVRSKSSVRYLVAVLFSVFPLLIYYVNDCRPYTALLGLSTAAAVAFLIFLETPSHLAIWLFTVFSLGAMGMHLFGALCPFALLLFVLASKDLRSKMLAARGYWLTPLAVCALLGLSGMAFYMKGGGIKSMAGPAADNPDTPVNSPSTWKNIAFVLYETLGFNGLGPPRNDLRLHPGLHTFLPYILPVVLGLIACAILALALLRDKQSPGIKYARALLAFCGVTLLVLFVPARMMHFGFYGRHVMGLIGVVCCAIALLLLASPPKFARLAGGVLLFAWVVSSARLLFVYSYGKDDVRTVLRLAKDTHLPILWDASSFDPANGYYNAGDPRELGTTPFAPRPLRSTEHWQLLQSYTQLEFKSQDEMTKQRSGIKPGKYLLVKGKPDISDPRGLWAEQIEQWHPQLINHLNGYDLFLVDVSQH